MSIGITVAIKGADTVLKLIRVIDKQKKFAFAQALNDTALDVQKWTIDELLPSKFTLRKRGQPWWQPRSPLGFRIQFARAPLKLTSTIGSSADFLTYHEHGGTKKAQGGRLSIPNRTNVAGSETSVIPARRKVGKLLGSSKAFKMSTATGEHVFERKGGKLVFLYTLQQSAVIKQSLGFEKGGSGLADRVFQKHYDRRFAEALKTARV